MFNLGLFDIGGFMPHGMCYLWNPALIRLHLFSDLLIGASYVAISLALARFAYRAKRHIRFSWIFVGLGVFIVACGTTHFMEIWTLWTPVYWLSGAVKAVTAAASVLVAIALPALLHKALPMIQSLKESERRKLDVEVANESLRQEISERTRAQREIEVLHAGLATRNVELATSNQELEAFTSSVAHDLRAPLRHIQAFSTTLIEDLGLQTDPGIQNLARQISDTARNMAGMVDELLSLARLGRQELSLQVTGLNSLVQEAIKELAPELKNRQIDWRFGELPFVDCDPALIRQVLFNLLSNAVKYTMPRKKAVIEVGICVEKSQQVIFVKDNGVGFNMKYADKLFGVFQRLHRREDFEGVGVGLAAAQRIVHKHGGRIWAEAEVDKGATFSFTLSAPPNHQTQEEQMLSAEGRR